MTFATPKVQDARVVCGDSARIVIATNGALVVSAASALHQVTVGGTAGRVKRRMVRQERTRRRPGRVER
jgi:hypothetical protein